MVEGVSSESVAVSEKDPYRDTWVRYLGYANEVGESFRALVPVAAVWATYGVSMAYVTADAVHKGRRAAEEEAGALMVKTSWQSDQRLQRKAYSHSVWTNKQTDPNAITSSLVCPVDGDGVGEGHRGRVAAAVADTFVWQALASVAIPGFTINRLCAGSLLLLSYTTRWPVPVRKWVTTAVGLAAIPVIITPIDRSVDYLMDSTLRKLYHYEGKSHKA
uniref:mitochondrial fission process protein 1 isoform X1 n=1 Tax=Myxine glutinosa TaxID=7769 RepID=UPI00358FD89F